VPNNLTGTITVKMTYDTAPFETTIQDAKVDLERAFLPKPKAKAKGRARK